MSKKQNQRTEDYENTEELMDSLYRSKWGHHPANLDVPADTQQL